VFDQTRREHERLSYLARSSNVFAREAFVRAGLQAGARAIDVGCGPLGALPVLAELVGEDGTVVGIDVNPTALARAREELDRLGVRGVELIAADVNALDQATALKPGQFDLAYCRYVLIFQPDPAATLRKIARLVRSGGRIIALDALPDPNYPWVHPPVSAVRRFQSLFLGLVARKGGTQDVARRYQQICEQADLRVIEQRGWFRVLCTGTSYDPGEHLALYRDVVLSMRSNLVAENLATDEEVEALAREMDAAQGTVESGVAHLIVEVIADVP
jgi:ubiquinone/menaquinone biosynthesis C-methylase UbiE